MKFTKAYVCRKCGDEYTEKELKGQEYQEEPFICPECSKRMCKFGQITFGEVKNESKT